ncbi:MAG: hypothetical protein C0599_09945 [Salinivirgaceae bacterium]|nr:MAG: hypothetical protein C0599_09945 [Salinivirgaceae bacterium]
MRHLKLFLITLFVLIGTLTNAQTLINETFSGGIPADWTTVNNDADSYYFKAPAQYAVNGTTDYAAAMGCSDDYLITPQLSITSADFDLSFDVGVESATYVYSFKVMVSTTDTDPASFTELANYVDLNSTTWQNNIIDLSPYNGQDIYIAFYVYSAGASYYSFGFDNIKVVAPVANDLSIDAIAMTPTTAFAGDEVTFTATINNNGSSDQTSKTVDFLIDGSSIGTQTIDVTSGNSTDASITWTAIEGDHSIEVTVPADDYTANDSFTDNFSIYSASAMVEDFEGSWPPAGWEAETWARQNFAPYEGTYHAYISSTGVNKLITPKVIIDGSSSISFWAKNGFGTYSIKLVYSTDKVTWTDVPSGSIALTGSYQNYNIDLSGITAGNYFLAFEYNLSYTSVYIDYVVGPEIAAELPEAATNPTPADVATDIIATTTLSWENAASGGVPTGYNLYFGTDGAGATTPTNLENGTTVTETTFTPSSVLDYETTYYWQVIPTNSVGDATSCPIWSFTTQSNPLKPIPFTENFTGVSAYTIPADWTSTNYFVYGDHGVGGTECLSVNMWSSTSNADVTTPPVGPLSATANQVKFDYRICDATFGSYPQTATVLGASDKVEVQLSTDNGTSFTTIHTIDQNNHISSLEFVTVTLNLDAAYNSENIKLRIKNTWGAGDYNVDIDNVVIRESPTDPVFAASNDTLSYFNLLTNIAYSKTVTVSNDGGGTLTIADGDLAITGTNASDFSLGTITYPIELATAESFEIEVILNSSAEGDKEASLDITHNGTKTLNPIGLVGSTYSPFTDYFENFDATAEDEIPAKWASITPGFTGVYVLADGFSTYSLSSPNCLTLTNSGTLSEIPFAITPAFEMGSKRLTFYAKRASYAENIIIGTITDPTDESTFTEIETIALTDTYAKYSVDFDSYGGSDMYVAFKHGVSRTYNSIYIDDLNWAEIPTTPICEVSPLSLDFGEATVADTDSDIITITNTGVNTLTINESDFVFSGTNAEDFSIADVTYPIELGTDETIDVTINFVPQAGGSRTANLEINHNGNNGTNTVTLEGVGYAGYVEDFNDAGTTFPPAGWTASAAWKALTFSVYEGAAGAWFNPSAEATDEKLITPLLDVNSGDTFSFWAKKSYQDATLTIQYTADTTGGGTWTDLTTMTITNTDYEEKTVDISSIPDGEHYIAFSGAGLAYTSTYIDYVKAPALAGTFEVAFTVTEQGTGNPIEGATIEMGGATTTTDASGHAAMMANNGNHSYTISHTMYENMTGSVVVNSAAQTIDVSMVALTGYTLTFNVIDETGNAFVNANININGTDLTTDASGVATIVLPDGEYPYTATAAGYADVVDTLTISGADLTENITMLEVYTMNFVVTDGTDPVEGAFIVVGGAVLSTNANGEASINALNGTYYYTVTKAYFETISGVITIDGADITENVVIRLVYYVDFTVTDENSDPIEGAEVTIEDSTIVTNASGFASIELADGTYNYEIVKEGYDTINNSFTVNSANIEINETMIMPQTTFDVTFTVKDQDDVVLEGALVELTDGTDNWSATTDINGMVSFSDMANATYDYTVSMTDYESATDQVTVADADVNETVNIQYVSINGIENIQFTVYPNPGNGLFNIEADGVYQMVVFNAIGNIVKTSIINGKSILDITNEPKGVYFIKLFSNEQTKTQRIIIE